MTTHHISPARRHSAAPDVVLPVLDVEVSTDGQFATDVPDLARRKVRAALRHCTSPVLRASVRLVRHLDPALPDPIVISASVNLNGRLVRVQTTAASPRAGLDALQHSLRTAVERQDRHRERHDHSRHPERTDDPAEDHAVHPHGTYAPTGSTVDEAIIDLEALDREFHLFHDIEADEDSLVVREESASYRLARVRHRPLVTAPVQPIELDTRDAPTLTVQAAVERLAYGGESYVFFVDANSGRGAVLHVQRNGDYGLVTLG